MVFRLRHNDFEKRIYQRYGNAIESDYTSSPKRQWLALKETLAPSIVLQNLSYTYDNVGNVATIDQSAHDYLGMGGPYQNNYIYDNQNRLVRGSETTSPFAFNFIAYYSPAGRLARNKCLSPPFQKCLYYGYDNQSYTHQPRVVYDSETNNTLDLYWDANDNVGAYRLLPDGIHFSEPATIAIPYDDFLLPMGYKPKDIKTYYFDENLAQWKELERVSVDTAIICI